MTTKGSLFRWSVMLALVLAELAIGDEGAQHSLVKRQVRTCPAGVPCKPIVSCQPMLDLLRTRTPEAFRKIRENICAVNGRFVSVCCDSGGGNSNGDLLPKDCSGAIFSRIIGGKEVPIGSLPFMALLGFALSGSDRVAWSCGGSLINQRYVLSAAHCFDRTYNPNPLSRVVLGEHDYRSSPDCQTLQNGQRICADKEQVFTSFPSGSIIMHESYARRHSLSDDIALIRLDRPAVYSRYVSPICLPPANADAGAFLSGRKGKAAGWGLTSSPRVDRTQSPVLLGVELPYVDRATCAPFFTRYFNLIDGQICFGGVENKDTCSADSGGPVIGAKGTSPPFFLLGVTSSGAIPGQCGVRGVPAVYTDVAHYRQWIVSKLRP